jgi:hypothetical protein
MSEVETKTISEPFKLWIAALRSGEYEQCQSELQTGGSYCCLGVACRVAEKEGIALESVVNHKLEGGDLSVEPGVITWLGIDTEGNADVDLGNALGTSLVSLNDAKRYSFLQIADFIEDHWRKLLVTT